jgi:Bacterial transcriptional activator domain
MGPRHGARRAAGPATAPGAGAVARRPLADLPGTWAATQRDLLQQQRLDALLLWARTELRRGRPEAPIGRLREALVRYPLVEPLIARFIEALYLGGRGAEALDYYAKPRARLVEDLDAEPGTELRRLHQSILRGELPAPRANSADVPPPGAGAGPLVGQVAGPVVAPAQLPAAVGDFVGRVDLLAALDRLRPTGPEAGPSLAVAVTRAPSFLQGRMRGFLQGLGGSRGWLGAVALRGPR